MISFVVSFKVLYLQLSYPFSFSYPYPCPYISLKLGLSRAYQFQPFSFLTKLCSIYTRKSLAIVVFSDIEPLNAFRMAFFMIMMHMSFDLFHLSISFLSSRILLSVRGERESTLNVKSISMTTRTIKRFSCYDLKLELFSIGK